jgi:AcrR family transcriptional regulator
VVRTLSTADERREAVLVAAMHTFAERGLHGTPTTAVAQAAGISHAYLFRLFPTKVDLAVAVAERCMARIHAAFVAAAAQASRDREDVLPAMGQAYVELLAADPELLLLQLHAHAASPEHPEMREAVRAGWQRLVEMVLALSGAPGEEVQRFFAHGMLLNIVAALDLGAVDAPWANTLTAKAAPPAETEAGC